MFLTAFLKPKDPSHLMLPKAAYALILIIGAVMAAALGYGTFLGNLPSRLVPVIEAADQIQIQVSLAQLRAGAPRSPWNSENDLWSHYDRAEDLVDFLLQDGKGMLPGTNTESFQILLLRTREQIETCRKIAERRFTPVKTAQGRARSDDAEFALLLALADEIHVQAGIVARDTMANFRKVQFSLILACVLLAALSMLVIYRFDRHRARDYMIIQGQNQQLQATEQQLRASNQQLHASNQQLQATEQQLRASYQQLQAGDQALRMSERRYRSLFANMSEGMLLFDRIADDDGKPQHYRIEDVNLQFEEIYSITRQQAVGRLLEDVIGKEEAGQLSHYAANQAGNAVRFERYSPGLDRHFLICVYSWERGRWAAVYNDITGQKKAASASRREAVRLETLMNIGNYKAADEKDLLAHALDKALCMLDCSSGFIYHYDDQSRTFTPNTSTRNTERQCAVPQPLVEKSVEETGALDKAVLQKLAVVLNTTGDQADPSGKQSDVVKFLVTPVIRNGRAVAVACAADRDSDFTDNDAREFTLLMDSVWKMLDLRREQEQRTRLETRLQKLESVGVLAGGIAHDFNNLLTAILANVTFSKVQVRRGEAIGSRLEEIEMACVRAQDLTQQLLTFAKGGKPIKKLACLEPIIRDSATLAVSGSNVQCHVQIPDDLCSAEVDAGQIGQVINNLVLNAVQAMPTGGTIRVKAENTAVERESALPVYPGRYVRLSVLDNGIGILPEHLGKIFDPYFTTKQKGSGLGLAVSHSVVAGHGGHIAVDSRIGEGTAFHVYLPASSDPVFTARKSEQMPQAGSGSVLIMDDEEMLRRISTDILKRSGYEVESTPDGRTAIDLYAKRVKEGRPFDVVILDLTVPGGMGGKDAIVEILKIDPEARVIVSSGYCNDPVMSDPASYGFCGLVPKPYSMKTLSEAVNRILRPTGQEGNA